MSTTAARPSAPVPPVPPPPPAAARTPPTPLDDPRPPASPAAMYRRLLRFLRPYSWQMAGTVVCSVVSAGLDIFSFALLIPFLNLLFLKQPLPAGNSAVTRFLTFAIGWLLDPRDKMGSLETVILIILVAVSLKNLLVWYGGLLGAQLQEFVTRDLRNVVYGHLQRLPLPYFLRTKGGQITARVLVDTDQTKALITQIVTSAIQSVALIVGSVVYMFAVTWRLTLVALIIAPLITGVLQPILRRLRKNHRRLRQDYGEMLSVLQEIVAGMRLVKSFRAEHYEEQRFVDASTQYSRRLVRVTKLALLSQPVTEFLGTVVLVGLLWLGARQVLAGTLGAAELLTFLAVLMKMLQPLKQVTQLPTIAQASMAAAERIFDILDEPSEAALDRGTRTPPKQFASITFDHVSFSYAPDSELVLSDVSFTARRGEVVAIVGASGAGKSTLVDLIPRFVQPTGGRILLDDVDTQTVSLPALRALTGIVSQDTVLFNDTVRHNIGYGGEGRFTDDQIEIAARAANADAFIRELPDGYATVLGERGTRLSGGQRQRLAIARALLTDPPVLILDEATSSLDTESERLVQEAIDRLLAGRTVFVIAHRLSTVADAHQILVLDRGRIVERGTHAELLARRGTYHRLYTLQFRDLDDPGDDPGDDPADGLAVGGGDGTAAGEPGPG